MRSIRRGGEASRPCLDIRSLYIRMAAAAIKAPQTRKSGSEGS
jgi:hypothetical protein